MNKANLRLFYCGHCHCSFWATYRGYARVACEKPECQKWRKRQTSNAYDKREREKTIKQCLNCGDPIRWSNRKWCLKRACQDHKAACRQKKGGLTQYEMRGTPKDQSKYRRRVMKCENCGRRKLCIWTKICLDCKRAIEQGHDLDMGFYEGSHNPKAPHQPFSERSEL